mgnify:CR=1 FL=1
MLRFIFKDKEEKGEKKEIRTFWIYAVGEFVLVFLGILIALQVDNWNQDRRVRNLEKAMLHELLANLYSDLDDVETNIGMHNEAISSSKIILSFIDGAEPWNDSLAIHFGNLNIGSIFFENISSYESLKSLGIDLISNDSLRQQITHLYSVSYDYIASLEELSLKHTFEILNVSVAKLLYMTAPMHTYVPLDVSEMRASNEFRHNLMLYLSFNSYQLNTYSKAKDELLSLIDAIEKEIS